MSLVMKIIIDTISLVKFCIIEINDIRIIEWLNKNFDVHTTPKVYEDGWNHIISSNNEEAQRVYHGVGHIQHPGCHLCLDYVEECLGEINESGKVDEGEKTALALAMHISFTESEHVLFVTDDYKALTVIREIMQIHGIGSAESGFYMLRQVGMLNSTDIAVTDIEIASRSLQSELRDNDQPADIEQKPDTLFAQSVQMINYLRGKGATRSQCYN